MGALAAYLLIGVLNYAVFALQGKAMLFMEGARAEGSVEAAFFIIGWLPQLVFFLALSVVAPALAWLMKGAKS